MPWIKLDTGFFDHEKTAVVLMERGGANAILDLQRIWCWAGGNDTPDTRRGYVSDAVALASIKVDKRSLELLQEAGFLTRNGSGYHIHGWDDYQGSLIKRRERDRDSARERRAKDKTS